MRWNNRLKVERPEYPKMMPITTVEKARELLPSLLVEDPKAEIVDGGGRGVYVRVNNKAAETAAKPYEATRNFPLASNLLR